MIQTPAASSGGPPNRVDRQQNPYAVLPLHCYRVVLRPRRDLLLSGVRRAALLRGAFGTTLRQLVCHDLNLECVRCPLRMRCAYPAVFDPGAAAGGPTLKAHVDPPQPFVVRAAEPTTSERIAAGAELGLDLHVVGTAQRHAPHLLATLVRLAEDGLGPARVPLELDHVQALDARGMACAVAADGHAAVMRASAAPTLRAVDLVRHGDDAPAAVRVRFLTPTQLRQGGEITSTTASFNSLVGRLRARLGALATLFGDGPFDDDPDALAAAADRIDISAANVHALRDDQNGKHARKRRLALQGVVGEARYAGELGTFMPLLRLGELLHVGKHASFGLGRIQVDTRSPGTPG